MPRTLLCILVPDNLYLWTYVRCLNFLSIFDVLNAIVAMPRGCARRGTLTRAAVIPTTIRQRLLCTLPIGHITGLTSARTLTSAESSTNNIA